MNIVSDPVFPLPFFLLSAALYEAKAAGRNAVRAHPGGQCVKE
jgi:hypothetical protein